MPDFALYRDYPLENNLKSTNTEGFETSNTTEKPVKQYRPLVNICSPYSGDTEANLERIRQFFRFAFERGQIPLAAMRMLPQFMMDEDTEERELALLMDIVHRRMGIYKAM